MASRSRSRSRAVGGRRLTARQQAAQALRAAGARGRLGATWQEGGWFLGRDRTQPFDATKHLERYQVQWVDDLTGLPRAPTYGPNRVLNGRFDSGLSNWTTPDTAPSATTWVNGVVQMTAAPGGALARLRQQVTVEIGRRYRVSVRVVAMTGTPTSSVSIGVTPNGDAAYGAVSFPAVGPYTFDVPPATSTMLGLAFTASSTPGGTIQFDEVQVEEIILDESWMGPNLVRNDWTLESGWGLSGGSLVATGVSAFVAAFQVSFPFVANRVYSVTFTVAVTSGSVRAQFNGGTAAIGTTRNASGTYTQRIVANAGNTTLRFEAQSSGFTGTISGVVVQEIPGHPSFSPAENMGATPTARVNLLQRTEQATHASWGKNAFGAGVAPVVTQTGDVFRADFNCGDLTSISNRSRVTQIGFAAAIVGATYRARFQFRAATPSDVGKQVRWSVDSIPGFTGVLTLAMDWQTLSVTSAAVASAMNLDLVLETRGTFTNAAQVSAEFRQVDVRLAIYTGPAYPDYQRVGDGTAGVFDYGATGFPVWLEAQGVGRGHMTLGTVDFSATDALHAGMVAAKTSDAAAGMLMELSQNSDTTNGSMRLLASSLGGQNYAAVSRGSAVANPAVAAGNPAPHIGAVFGSAKISTDTLSISVNGAAPVTSNSDQGTGNFAAHRLYEGGRALDGTASLRLAGRWVPGFILDANVISADLAAAVLRETAAAVGHTY